MGKIAVIGATGHYGTRAIEEMIRSGVNAQDIVAIHRNEEKASALKAKGVETRFWNYSESPADPAAFGGADKLLFVSGNDADPLNRIRQQLAAVEAARQAGIHHIVYTGLAYPEKSVSGLENVHLATECAIKASGVPYTILRNTFYAEYTLVPHELKRAAASGRLMNLAGGRRINFVTRADMAKAAAAVLTAEGHEGKTYTITAPETYSYADVAALVSEIAGVKVEAVSATPEQMKAYLDELGVPPELQAWDSSVYQPGFAFGWAETADSALADLIGRDAIATPRDIVAAAFA